MKNSILILLLLLAFGLNSQNGPALTGFVLETQFGAASPLNDSTWRVNTFHPASQLGFGYNATQITSGMLALDGFNRRYRIAAVVGSPTFATAVIDFVELQDFNQPPVGVCVIYAPIAGSDLIPTGLGDGGVNGLTFAVKAKIENHNVRTSAIEISNAEDGNGFKDGSGDLPNNTVATIPSYGNFDLASDAARLKIEGDVVELSGGESGNRWGMQSAPGTFIQGDISGSGARIEVDGNTIEAQGESFEVKSRSGNVGLSADSNSVYLPDIVSAQVLGTDASGKIIPGNADDADADPTNELQTSETLPATPFGDILSTYVQGQMEEIDSKIITDVYLGEVAYLTNSGDDLNAEIGNPFLPFSTINQINAVADSSFLIIEADQNVYSNSPQFLMNDFSYKSENGSTYNHYLNTNLLQSSGSGNFLMNVTTLNLDTLARSRQLINGSFNSIEVNAKTVNAVTKGNVLAYFILGLNSHTSTSNSLSFKTDDLNFYGCSFINGTNKNLDFEAKKVVFLEDTFSNSNRQTESIVINRATGNTESVINVDVGYFLNNDEDELKRGLLTLSGTVNDTLLNSSISLNCEYYESGKVATTRQGYAGISTSGNGNRFSAEQVLRANYKNSKISYNYDRIEGSAIHQFYPLDNSNGDLISSTYEINIGIANVRNSILESWPNHLVDANSTILLTCESCLVTNDVAYRLNSTVSGKVLIKNSNITTVNTPVIYPRHNIYLEDVQFFNNGTFPLIDSPTPITAYLCNTNITRDRVGANVTLVYCEGQGEHNSETFTAIASQTDFTVSASKLPSDSANVRVYDDAGAKLRETDHYTYVASTGVVTLVTPATAGEKYTIEYYQ